MYNTEKPTHKIIMLRITAYVYLALVLLPTLVLMGGCEYLRGVGSKDYMLESHGIYLKSEIELFGAQRLSLGSSPDLENSSSVLLRQPWDLMPSYITIDEDNNLSFWSPYLLSADFGNVDVYRFYRTTPNIKELDSLNIVLEVSGKYISLIRGSDKARLTQIQ